MTRKRIIEQTFHIDNGLQKQWEFDLFNNSTVSLKYTLTGVYTEGCNFKLNETLYGKNTVNVVYSGNFTTVQSESMFWDFGQPYVPVTIDLVQTPLIDNITNKLVITFHSDSDGNPYDGIVKVMFELEEVML